nr:MAG TPA: hypothetical protein [Caudoviricetes sp.]
MDRYVIKYIQGAYENLWDITNYMVGTMGLFYDKPSTVTSSGSVVCYLSSVNGHPHAHFALPLMEGNPFGDLDITITPYAEAEIKIVDREGHTVEELNEITEGNYKTFIQVADAIKNNKGSMYTALDKRG